jgi:NAD(P)-dependent dehydrogenase (short-subunit alcohol dehydrogenase family)
VKEAFGRLDVLVNNAGIYEFAPLEAVTPEHFHKQFNLNVLGLLLASQEAVKFFGAEGGSIINISSLVSRSPVPNASVYSATKGAVDAITRSLAAELGPKRIRVNAIDPDDQHRVRFGGVPRRTAQVLVHAHGARRCVRHGGLLPAVAHARARDGAVLIAC